MGQHEPVRVSTTDGFDGLPVFSPDGNQLCWTSNRTSEKRSQLFLADWNHEAALTAIFSAPKRTAVASNKNNLVSKDVSLTNGKKDKSGLSAKISGDDIRTQVTFLASDKLEGRMSGTKGTKMAADYITSRFNEIGLKPLGDNGSFFQEFQFTSGMKIIPRKNPLEIFIVVDKALNLKTEKVFRQ